MMRNSVGLFPSDGVTALRIHRASPASPLATVAMACAAALTAMPGRGQTAAPVVAAPAAASPAIAAPSAETDAAGIRSVIVEGVGLDPESARRDAYRMAVRQVLGALVDTETLAVNDQLITDKVVVFSDGFVDHVEPLPGGEAREADGLVRVRVRAFVKAGGLARSLRQHAVAVKGESVTVDDPASLLANAVTAQERKEAVWQRFWERAKDYPANCLAATVGQPEVIEVVGGVAECDLRVTLAVRPKEYEEFTSRLIAYLGSLPPQGAGNCLGLQAQEFVPAHNNQLGFLEQMTRLVFAEPARAARLLASFDRVGTNATVDFAGIAAKESWRTPKGVEAYNRVKLDFAARQGSPSLTAWIIPEAKPPFAPRWYCIDPKSAPAITAFRADRRIKCNVSVRRGAEPVATEAVDLRRFGFAIPSHLEENDRAGLTDVFFIPGFEAECLGTSCEFTVRLRVPEAAFTDGLVVEAKLVN